MRIFVVSNKNKTYEKMNELTKERITTLKQHNQNLLSADQILTGQQFRNKKRKENSKPRKKNKKL